MPQFDALPDRTATPLKATYVFTGWLVFATSVALLTGLSAIFLDPRDGALSASAGLRCLYWCASGVGFAIFVLFFYGQEEATSWLIGYMLEFALSFDNLFLFHMVFSSYATPTDQIYRGIVTAMRWGLCVRFTLFFVSEGVFNLTFLFRWIFGAILLYSGVKVMFVEEDEGDPTENYLVKLVRRCLPVDKDYADGGAFFVCKREAIDHSLGVPSANKYGNSDHVANLSGEGKASDEDGCCRTLSSDSLLEVEADSSPVKVMEPERKCRGCMATPLFLVVLTLMIIDALFAVDSVTAKVSMVTQYDDRVDLFLNFTSTAFAMLCMPSLYFIIALLVNLFKFLKYGLGAILILIGLKLIASEYISIREDASCMIMISILGLSVLASLLSSDARNASTEAAKDVESTLPASEQSPSA